MLLARNVRDTLKKVIKNHPRIFSGCSNWTEVAKEYNSTVPKMIEVAYEKLKKRYEVPLNKLKIWADKGDIVAQLILINTDVNHKIKTIKVNPISKMKKIAKKKYVFPEYFLQEKTEIIPITEKIYPFKYKGLNLFVHHNRKSSHRQSKWMVSEKSTGLQISSYGDGTKQEAIERAKKRIIVVSKKQVMKCIKRGLKDLKKITRATKIWEKKTSPKKTIKRKKSKKNPLTVKEIIRKLNVWLDSMDVWLSKGMFGKAAYSYGRAEGYFNSLKKSEQISSRLWNKLKQSGIKLDEYRKTKKSSVKKRSFFKKRNPIPKRDIIEKINHSLDIAERDIQEGHHTGAEYWREKAYILFWETLTAVERTQYMNINDRLETVDYLIKKTERTNPGGSRRNPQLYGIDLELLWMEWYTDEDFEKLKKIFSDILHKHRVVDALGQISYSTDSGISVEGMRWHTKKEIDAILDDLRDTGFGDNIDYAVYPKGDFDKIEREWKRLVV